MLRYILLLSMRRPRAVLAAVAAVTLFAAMHIPAIELRLDGRSLIPLDHPSLQASDRAAEMFGLRDLVVIAIRDDSTGVYTPGGLRLLASLSDSLARVDGIIPLSVASLSTLPRISITDDVLDLRPLVASAREIDTAVAAQLRCETEALDLNNGVLVSRDGRAAAIYAEVEPQADREALRRNVEALVERHRRAPFQIAFSGTAMAQAELGAAAATDLVRLVPLVLVIIGIVVTVAFRNAIPALVILAEVAASLIWTTGLMGALGESVFVTTLALPVVLLVIGVSDDLYVLNRYFFAVRASGGRIREDAALLAFEEARKPILLTGLTTMLGLLSLLTTSLEPQRVFGVYGAVSVAFSTLFTFSLVPALLTVLVPTAVRLQGAPLPARERAATRLLWALDRVGPRAIAATVAVVATVAGVFATRLRIEDSWIRNLPDSSATAQGDRAINEWLAGTNTLEILFDSGRSNGFLEPETMAALGRVERALVAHPAVGAVESVYTEVVRVTASLAGVSAGEYGARLARAGGLPGRVEVHQAIVLLESMGRSPLVDRLDPEYRRARMTVFVRSANYSRIAEVMQVVRAADPLVGAGGIIPFGDGWIGHSSIGLLVNGQVRSVALATLSNTAVLALLFRSLTAALVAISPVVIAILIVFGFLAAAGIPLGTANSMFAAIALGVGTDYSIHFTAVCRERLRAGLRVAAAVRETMYATGPAILTGAVALPAGFLVLQLSAVRPNRELGLLIAVSMVACAAMTLIVVPTLALLGGLGDDGQLAGGRAEAVMSGTPGRRLPARCPDGAEDG